MTTEGRLNDRLARVAAAKAAKAAAVGRPDAERRCLLRARAAVGAVIRDALLRNGDDPDACTALRHADEAMAELAAFPDTPALRRADNRLLAGTGDAAVAEAFDAKIADLVGRYRDGLTHDFRTESMACLFAWSLATSPPASPRRRKIPSPALRERVPEGRVRAERSEVSESERRRARPHPPTAAAMTPSRARDPGEG